MANLFVGIKPTTIIDGNVCRHYLWMHPLREWRSQEMAFTSQRIYSLGVIENEITGSYGYFIKKRNNSTGKWDYLCSVGTKNTHGIKKEAYAASLKRRVKNFLDSKESDGLKVYTR